MKRLLCCAMCLITIAQMISSSVVSAYAAGEDEPGYVVPASKDDTSFPASTGASDESSDEDMTVPQIRVVTEEGNGVSLQKADGYVNASISITDIDGSVLSDSCLFKVRGNTTAMAGLLKKAFTFKFEKKKNVLGLGKGKKWALLANTFDPTLLRNHMAFQLAEELGLPYTSSHRFVELWVDNSYRGCYELYEPVQEGKDRVDIDIDSNDGKKDFLIEYEAQREEEGVTYFKTNGLRFIASEPEEPDEEQLAYITDTMNGIITVLNSGSREEIEAVIDVDSFASYYLLNEYLKTFDFDMSSVFFFYKDGKLYAGPAWDYDLSTGNTNIDLVNPRAKTACYTDGLLQNNRNLFRYLCGRSWFMDEVRTVYEEHYDYIESISADGGLLDQYREQYQSVFDRNFTVWKVSRWWYNYQKKPLATYDENFDYLKNWCSERNLWLSDHFDLFSYEFLRGDADGNGTLDIVDATVVQRVLAGVIQDTDGKTAVRAAVTGDELSIFDATVIQRYLVNMGNPYELDTAAKVKFR